jgi:hypothetical protein
MKKEHGPRRVPEIARTTAEHRQCPPHGPLLVGASGEGVYTATCLSCGVQGPDRNDGWEAKLAFDERFQPSG